MFKHNGWTMNKYGVCYRYEPDSELGGNKAVFATPQQERDIHAAAIQEGYTCKLVGKDYVWNKEG